MLLLLLLLLLFPVSARNIADHPIKMGYAQLSVSDWSNYKFSTSSFELVIRRNCYFSLLRCAAGFSVWKM